MMVNGEPIPIWCSSRKVYIGNQQKGYRTSEFKIVKQKKKYTCKVVNQLTQSCVNVCECETFAEATERLKSIQEVFGL